MEYNSIKDKDNHLGDECQGGLSLRGIGIGPRQRYFRRSHLYLSAPTPLTDRMAKEEGASVVALGVEEILQLHLL